MSFGLKRWMWVGSLIAVVAIVGLNGCRKHAANPFPATGDVTGWEKTGDTRVFDAKDLWQYIDGDSEQYIQAGVVSTSTTDYRYNGKLEAVVDVYTMKDAGGATKILENGQGNDAVHVQVGDAGLAYAQSVTFRKGPYLVRIVAYQSAPDASQALMALAHGVEAKL